MGLSRDLVHIHPAPGAGWVALRASTTVLTGLCALAAVDRVDLGAFVAFGALASAYGNEAPTSPQRWRLQTTHGALITLAVVSGAAAANLEHGQWLMIAIPAAWAGLGSVLSQRHRWQPPGALFLVLASGTSGAMPARVTELLAIITTTAGTAALAVALGAVEVRVRSADHVASMSQRPPGTVNWSIPVASAAATITAGAIALASGLAYPSWAMVAAVAPFSAPSLPHQVVRGVHRVAGTASGLVLAALVFSAGPLPVSIFIVVATAMHAATEMLVARHYGLALFFITPLALLLTQAAEPMSPGPLLTSRILETVVGVAIGIGLAVTAAARPSTRLTA